MSEKTKIEIKHTYKTVSGRNAYVFQELLQEDGSTHYRGSIEASSFMTWDENGKSLLGGEAADLVLEDAPPTTDNAL